MGDSYVSTVGGVVGVQDFPRDFLVEFPNVGTYLVNVKRVWFHSFDSRSKGFWERPVRFFKGVGVFGMEKYFPC